jgi:hypothetical protein
MKATRPDRLPYLPQLALDRLARVLADIARNPASQEKVVQNNLPNET